MGGNVRIIVDKDNKRRTAKVYTDTAKAILSHYSLWSSDSEKFDEVLDFYEVGSEDLTPENLAYGYGMAYIDWDNKVCHQFMGDYYFDGYFLSSLRLELMERVCYQEDFPPEYMDFNVFLQGLHNGAYKKEILTHVKYKDGKSVDLKYFLCKKINTQTLIDMFENLRNIESKPELMENFGFKASEDITLENIDFIDFYKFPVNLESWENKIYGDNWEEKLKENLSKFPNMPKELK